MHSCFHLSCLQPSAHRPAPPFPDPTHLHQPKPPSILPPRQWGVTSPREGSQYVNSPEGLCACRAMVVWSCFFEFPVLRCSETEKARHLDYCTMIHAKCKGSPNPQRGIVDENPFPVRSH
ncbi:hypothetical protein VTJ04DRAFT_6097 [Mycothermus thermophilus]|uniref:uncharacterized protein n=1 Tax=Humicola insolens TaxID=85995 RepID=UPI0037436B15